MGFSWGRAAKDCLVEQRGELSFQGTLGGVSAQAALGGGCPAGLVLGGDGGWGPGIGIGGPVWQGWLRVGVVSVFLAHWCIPSPGRGPGTQ